MAKHDAIVVACLVTLVCPHGVVSAQPVAQDPLKITVRILADNGVPREILKGAQRETTRIYEQMAIELIWQDGLCSNCIIVRVLDKPIGQAPASVLGYAPGQRGRMGTLLYAFYSHVDAFAREHEVPHALTLGSVIAHEMGHLLLPYGSHSQVGIMSAAWYRAEVRHIQRGGLRFTRDQAQQIRRKARAYDPSEVRYAVGHR